MGRRGDGNDRILENKGEQNESVMQKCIESHSNVSEMQLTNEAPFNRDMRRMILKFKLFYNSLLPGFIKIHLKLVKSGN